MADDSAIESDFDNIIIPFQNTFPDSESYEHHTHHFN